MSTSKRQAAANRKNAKRSTGPKTSRGKKKVSGNALKHGILSTKLILPHEDRNDFDALFNEMTQSLKPEGTMENILVEKIAANLWRQRRLMEAENALLGLQTLPNRIDEEMYNAVEENTNPNISIPDLESSSEIKIALNNQYIHELNDVDLDKITNWSELEELAPTVYKHFQLSFENINLTIEQYLAQANKNLAEFISSIKAQAEQDIENSIETDNQSPQLQEWIIAKNAIAQGDLEKNLSRYQTSLDNELYKALKALRDQQQWRHEQRVADAVVIEDEA